MRLLEIARCPVERHVRPGGIPASRVVRGLGLGRALLHGRTRRRHLDHSFALCVVRTILESTYLPELLEVSRAHKVRSRKCILENPRESQNTPATDIKIPPCQGVHLGVS